jgi:membrane protease YdiL (CAAX protease family)
MPWDFWLIFLVLAVVLPWRGRAKLQKLLAKPTVDAPERVGLYASTIAFQWIAVAVVGWRVWAHRLTAAELGLVIPSRLVIFTVAIVGAVVLSGLQVLNLRRVGRSSSKMKASIQALAERIFPQSSVEFAPYIALAVTAGVCEEFLYRGFAIAALTRVGLPVWLVIVLSAILFGVAHLYQGRGGLVGTMIIGIAFGIARVAYNSIVPVVFWHAGIDIAAGIAGPRYLLKSASPAIPA